MTHSASKLPRALRVPESNAVVHAKLADQVLVIGGFQLERNSEPDAPRTPIADRHTRLPAPPGEPPAPRPSRLGSGELSFRCRSDRKRILLGPPLHSPLVALIRRESVHRELVVGPISYGVVLKDIVPLAHYRIDFNGAISLQVSSALRRRALIEGGCRY